MRVHTATLAGGSSNADRVFVTDHAVVLLDGASAFAPVDIDPGEYAGTLGEHIADQLDHDPGRELASVVADAIRHAVTILRLGTGPSPSSTVTILRSRADAADLYVLGDSPIHYGTGTTLETLTDNRLSSLPVGERKRYRDSLARGAGYTDRHRTILVALQHEQRKHRNRPGGYWIAANVPDAAYHAVTAIIPASQIQWAVLATDGAADLIDHHGQPEWRKLAHFSANELHSLLETLHAWEADIDPTGQLLPRAKRHDDKTVASLSSIW